MDNVFLTSMEMEQPSFNWNDLGDIKEGRGNLGAEMPVIVYRLMQFTMRDVLTKAYGKETANNHIRESGRLAGVELAKNVLDIKVGFDDFVANLAKTLLDLKVGVLRLESVSQGAENIVLTVGEDLDCSGLPITGEVVCHYDEGFIAGILDVYTGKTYKVREVDCWATGDRTCRFQCSLVK